MDSYLSMYLRIKIYEFLDENNNFIKKHCFLKKKKYTKIKHHSIFLTAVHHTKKEVNYSLIVVNNVNILVVIMLDVTVIVIAKLLYLVYSSHTYTVVLILILILL